MQGGGGGFQRNDTGRSQNNDWGQPAQTLNQRNTTRPQFQQSSNDDDEWDNAPAPKEFTSKSSMNGPQAMKDWDIEEIESSYQPSTNNLQREPSTFDPPKRNSFKESNKGSPFGGNRRGNFNGGFENRSNSSYSNNNRIPYRSEDNPPPASNAPSGVKNDDYVIDWDKANKEAEAARKARWEKCPKMLKNFYIEHPEVTNMTDEEVEKFRVENKNIVVARTFSKEDSTEAMPKPTTKFEHAFEKFPDLMHEIKKAGFEKPSPIQSQMWPILLRGEDCIGIAQTGTGKTLAFLLPALIHTDAQPHPRGIEARGGPNVLVLAPTRELAIQIEKEVAKYQFRGIRA